MKTSTQILVLVLVGALAVLGTIVFANKERSPPGSPPGFNPNYYDGEWFSVNEIPQRFAEGCTCTGAAYSLTNDNHLIITNVCNKSGVRTVAYGEATPVDDTLARFNVKFQNQTLPISGSYNVIAVGAAIPGAPYPSALVGNNERTALWILSRDRNLSQEVYQQYVQIALAQGYPVEKLVPVQQTMCE